MLFKKKLTGLFIIVAIIVAVVFFIGNSHFSNEEVIFEEEKSSGPMGVVEKDNILEDKFTEIEEITPINKVTEIVIPENILLDVPFTSQAPYGVWDEYHEEACEEASLIMLKYYLDGKKLTAEIAEKEIQEMIAFQLKNYGDYRDSDAEGVLKLAEDFYGMKNLKVIYDFEKEGVKKELAKGNPIIIPAAGRLLGNPFFTPPGPLYHNLVLIGYAGDSIITNDPGTKRGQEYQYGLDTIYNAIHDFPGSKELIENGRKAMIVVD